MPKLATTTQVVIVQHLKRYWSQKQKDEVTGNCLTSDFIVTASLLIDHSFKVKTISCTFFFIVVYLISNKNAQMCDLMQDVSWSQLSAAAV